MKSYFVLVGVMVASLGSAQADTFRWVDDSGNVHYGDRPAAEARQAEQKKFGDAAADNSGLPYETRRAQENYPVTLYASASCGDVCTKARDFLNKRGIPFTEKNLSTKEEIDAYRQMSGANTIPALTVGKTLLMGFLAEQWGSELDIAGYPKIAPYRPQASSKPASAQPATQIKSETP